MALKKKKNFKALKINIQGAILNLGKATEVGFLYSENKEKGPESYRMRFLSRILLR